MLFDENIIYFEGRFLFDAEPDWDLLATGLDMLKRDVGFRLVPDRGYRDDTGYWWLPLVGQGNLEARRGRLRFSSREDHEKDRERNLREQHRPLEARASDYFKELRDDLETFFGCAVDFRLLYRDLSHPEDMREIDRLTEKSRFFILDEDDRTVDKIRPLAKTSNAGIDPFSELDELIGLAPVKKQVRQLADLLSRGGRDNLPCLHMVFRGNPGTGKTTVARIIGRIFDNVGITSGEGVFVETDRDGLVGHFVGSTASKTHGEVKSASGGVLFIDEAYALGLYGGVSRSDGSRFVDFGEEALAALVKDMEDKRGDFVCIMAGYTDLMDQMIALNPGLRDRIGFSIDFPDYDADELYLVFNKFAYDDGYTIANEAECELRRAIDEIVAGKDANFSNARLIRKIYERVRTNTLTCDDNEGIFEVAHVASAFEDDDLAKLLEHNSPRSSFGFCA